MNLQKSKQSKKLGEMNQDHDKAESFCPFCVGQVRRHARYCHHCGRPISLGDRIKAGIRTSAEVASFIATAVAIIFLVFSTKYTGEQLAIQRQTLENEQSKSLIQDSVNRVQLGLLTNQLEETRRAIALQQQAFKADSEKASMELKRILEERRPRLEMDRVDCKRDSASFVLYFNLTNHGKASAVNCVTRITIRELASQKDIQNETVTYSEILSAVPKVSQIGLNPNTKYVVCLIRTQMEYTWQEYGIPYRTEKYFFLEPESEPLKCSCKSMSLEQVKEFWKK